MRSPVISAGEHWHLQDVMSLYEQEATTIRDDMQAIVKWRDDSVPFVDILKTMVAFKPSTYKLAVSEVTTRAAPLKKDLEEQLSEA